MNKEKETKVGYKVVCGKCIFRPATSDALQSVRYRVDEWTWQSGCGPFACFETRNSAFKFKKALSRTFSAYGNLCIFEVEYIASDEDTLWKCAPPFFVGTRGGHYPVSSGLVERPLESCPKGTVLASAVRLIKKAD